MLWSCGLGVNCLIFPDPFGGHTFGIWQLRPLVSLLVVIGVGGRGSPLLPSAPTVTTTLLAVGGVGGLECPLFPSAPTVTPSQFAVGGFGGGESSLLPSAPTVTPLSLAVGGVEGREPFGPYGHAHGEILKFPGCLYLVWVGVTHLLK